MLGQPKNAKPLSDRFQYYTLQSASGVLAKLPGMRVMCVHDDGVTKLNKNKHRTALLLNAWHELA